MPKLGDFTNYPYGGYWEKKTQGRNAQMETRPRSTPAPTASATVEASTSGGRCRSLVNFSTPMGLGGVAGIGATPALHQRGSERRWPVITPSASTLVGERLRSAPRRPLMLTHWLAS